jgi:hypothetical protein
VSLTLDQAAAVVGGHCWAERRLFERLGSWVAPSVSMEAKLLLDRHSQHAAWRAGQWWDRLPVLAQVDRDDLVTSPDRWAVLFAATDAGRLAPADESTADVSRLALAYRLLLPRLAASYERLAGLTSPMADGPVIRTLRHVAADIRADWAEGEFLLEDLIVSAGHATAAAAAVAEAESALLS